MNMPPSPETKFWSCKNCGHNYAVDDVAYPSLPEHLLTTNFPPTKQEQELCHPEDVAQDLVVLDQQTASLQHTLDALHTRRGKLEAQLTARKSIMSPYRRLPSEIVVEIIRRATIITGSDGNAAREKVTLNTKHGIWTYSHVCQMWRANALSMPSFWSTISIDLGSKPSDGQSKCVETILSRTRNRLLSFEFGCSLRQKDRGIDAVRHSLRHFTDRATQWREVLFMLPPNSLDDLRFVRNRIPRLEKLSFLQLFHGNQPQSLPANCFEVAPALREVTFHGIEVCPQHCRLPWSQITHYTATLAHNNPLESLRLMPNLQFLDLACIKSNAGRQLELKNLRKLRVVHSSGIVSALTLPALCDLDMSAIGREVWPLIDLIERSACHLDRLRLGRSSAQALDVDALIRLLELIPTLSVLDLSENVNVMIILRLDELDHLLPVLTELVLPPVNRIRHESWTKIIRFLQQRCSPQFVSSTTHTTHKVESVVFAGEIQPLGPEIESLQRDGLRVSFG